jgi:spermidine/putrescine transport system substrate-binding protein
MQSLRVLLAAVAVLLGAGILRAQTLNLFCWSEYVPQPVIDSFTKETGIRVNLESYDSNEKMLAKLLAGGAKYDLIQPSEYVVESLIKQGRLEELNHAAIPNLANLDPKFMNMPHDPGNRFGVPWMAGSVGIVVNTDKIKEAVGGYADVFSGRFRGRIVVLDDNREIVSWALATLGIPINEISKDSLAKTRPVIKGWLPQVKAFDSDSPKAKFLSGEADIGIVWSGEAAILWRETAGSGKFRFILPKEGAHMFVDSLCIPRGAPHRDEAAKFINHILKPEVSALISREFPYTNPNTAARALLGADELGNPASYPPGEPKLDIFRDIGRAARDVDRMMTELRSR